MIAELFKSAFPKYDFVLSAPEIRGLVQLTVFNSEHHHICVIAIRDGSTISIVSNRVGIQGLEMSDPDFLSRVDNVLCVLNYVRNDRDSDSFLVKLAVDGII